MGVSLQRAALYEGLRQSGPEIFRENLEVRLLCYRKMVRM